MVLLPGRSRAAAAGQRREADILAASAIWSDDPSRWCGAGGATTLGGRGPEDVPAKAVGEMGPKGIQKRANRGVGVPQEEIQPRAETSGLAGERPLAPLQSHMGPPAGTGFDEGSHKI